MRLATSAPLLPASMTATVVLPSSASLVAITRAAVPPPTCPTTDVVRLTDSRRGEGFTHNNIVECLAGYGICAIFKCREVEIRCVALVQPIRCVFLEFTTRCAGKERECREAKEREPGQRLGSRWARCHVDRSSVLKTCIDVKVKSRHAKEPSCLLTRATHTPSRSSFAFSDRLG